MIAFRLVLVVTLVGALLAVVLYGVTGNGGWLRIAKAIGLGGGALLLLYLLLFALERLLAL